MKKANRNLAWHFTGPTLRDGSTIPADGEWLTHKGELALCESGLHFSRLPHQALEYAPGATLCLVEVGGDIVENNGDDKGVCSNRKIVARMDATELLRFYARMQAVKVLEYWDTEPPEVVCDYLMTGDESIGPLLGTLLGPLLGTLLGTLLGPLLGTLLGPLLGTLLGPLLGPLLGTLLGPLLGPLLGTLLGPLLGTLQMRNSMR